MLIQLSESVVRRISSSQCITSVWSVVKELMENSMDAGATNVEIKLENYGLDRIEVKDNGCGIAVTDTACMALPHYTSKLSTVDDLQHLSTYGFRGEALVSDVEITTKTSDDTVASTYTLSEAGHVTDKKPSHLPQGTTVIASNLFSKFPVRRQFYSSVKKKKEELSRVLDLVMSYSVIRYDVRFVLRSEREILWQKQSLVDVRSALLKVVGSDAMSGLRYVRKTVENKITLEAFLPVASGNKSVCRSTDDWMFTYVNQRPVQIKSVSKLIRQKYLEASQNTDKHPVSFIHIQLPSDELDVNLEPNKNRVMIQNEKDVLSLLEELLVEHYGSSAANKNNMNVLPAVDENRNPNSESLLYNAAIDSKNSHNMNEQSQFNGGDRIYDTESSEHLNILKSPESNERLMERNNGSHVVEAIALEAVPCVELSEEGRNKCLTSGIGMSIASSSDNLYQPKINIDSDGIGIYNLVSEQSQCTMDSKIVTNLDSACVYSDNSSCNTATKLLTVDSCAKSNDILTESTHNKSSMDLFNLSYQSNTGDISNNSALSCLSEVHKNSNVLAGDLLNSNNISLNSSLSLLNNNATGSSSQSRNTTLPCISELQETPNFGVLSDDLIDDSILMELSECEMIENNSVENCNSNAFKAGLPMSSEKNLCNVSGNIGVGNDDEFSEGLVTACDWSKGRMSSEGNTVIDSGVRLFTGNQASCSSLNSFNDRQQPQIDDVLHGLKRKNSEDHDSSLYEETTCSDVSKSVSIEKSGSNNRSCKRKMSDEHIDRNKEAKRDMRSACIDKLLMTQKNRKSTSSSSSSSNKLRELRDYPQFCERSSVTVDLRMSEVKKRFLHLSNKTSSDSIGQQSRTRRRVIGQIKSLNVALCCNDRYVTLFDPMRARERLIYERLMNSFVFPGETLNQPVKLNDCNLRGLMDVLMCMEHSTHDSVDPFVYFNDVRLSNNGFKVRMINRDNESVVELYAVPGSVNHVGLQELCEILSAVKQQQQQQHQQQGSSGEIIRPSALIHYIEGETVRMIRQESRIQTLSEMIDTYTDLTTTLPDVNHCIHGRPIYYNLHEL